MTRLAWLIVFAAVGYLGYCYVPVATTYFRVRFASQTLAQNAIDPSGRTFSAVRAFADEIERDTGLRLAVSDINVSGDGRQGDVQVTARIPVVFVGIGTEHVHDFVIAAHAAVPRNKGGMP